MNHGAMKPESRSPPPRTPLPGAVVVAASTRIWIHAWGGVRGSTGIIIPMDKALVINRFIKFWAGMLLVSRRLLLVVLI